jgi:mRNA-degrading endonuclease YafQ of YafQ-DinJ toxin-antitoxin module
MPGFRLSWTPTFLNTLRKFLRRHPDLEGVVADVLQQLEKDPYAARLKLHALKGKHSNKHAVSLTYSYRIVLILKITGSEVVLLDIGSHDEVYRG